MDEATLALVMTARNLAGKEVDHLGGQLGGVEKGAGKAGVGIVGLGGKLKALGKVAAVVGGVGIFTIIAGLAGATKAAADEEKGIARLNAALKANDKSFSGNTDQVEALIKKREALAFSDDDLRSSLAILVTSTKDTTKATELQTIAMDLARLKNIDLASASTIVAKASTGSAGALKKMGIEVKKGATATEILAAIQKASAGQAKKYGETSAGAMESFQIAVGDVVEDVGGAFLPIMAKAFNFARTDVIPVVEKVIGTITDWVKHNKWLTEGIASFVTKLGAFVGMIVTKVVPVVVDLVKRVWNGGLNEAFSAGVELVGSLIDVLGDFVTWIANNKAIMAGLGVVADVIGRAFGALGSTVKAMLKIIPTAFRLVANAAIDLVNGLIDVVNTFIGAYNAIPVLGDIPKFGHLPKLRAPAEGGQDTGSTRGSGVSGLAAKGGFYLAGDRVQVNERGMEYFQPAEAGRIVPSWQTPGGGGDMVVQTTIVMDGREIARQVDRHAYHTLRRSPATSERS